MKQLIVYQNTEDNTLAIVTPADCGISINEIARKDVPKGLPFKIVDYDLFPWEHQEFMDAWEVDFSNPDGYGIGAEAWFAEQEKA
jgi:hypothetical protein